MKNKRKQRERKKTNVTKPTKKNTHEMIVRACKLSQRNAKKKEKKKKKRKKDQKEKNTKGEKEKRHIQPTNKQEGSVGVANPLTCILHVPRHIPKKEI